METKNNKSNKMKIGILGYGEIGKVMEKIYLDFEDYEIKIKDLDRDDGFENIEILNICIPYSNEFIKIVSREIKKFRPKLTIIHSTVNQGTTLEISNSVPKDSYIVHSPVRGVHPKLYEGIKTFVKYVGGDSTEGKNKAEEHLKSLGLKVKVLENSLTTELGKLLDTTYYGLLIAWHGEMKELCDEKNVNFEEVATEFNKTYNEGYKQLGMENVIRPVLYPPKKNKIGGHCIISNARILNEIFDSEALDLILKYS